MPVNAENPAETGQPFAMFIPPRTDLHIENEAFLDSYVRYCAWIRLSQLYDNVVVLRHTNDHFDRLSAASHFYMGVGAVLEDIAANLFALICWNRNADLRIADALFRTSFRRDPKSQPGIPYLLSRADEVSAGRKVNIDFKTFGLSLQGERADRVLNLLGLDWKPEPSIGIAMTQGERNWWNKLPNIVSDFIHIMTHPGTEAMGLMYNKVKHGPQMVVVNLGDHLSTMADTEERKAEIRKTVTESNLHPDTIQILFKGARTKRRDDEEFPATITLNDHYEPFANIFDRHAYQPVKINWVITSWLRKIKYGCEWQELPTKIVAAEKLVGELRAMETAGKVLAKAANGNGPPLPGGQDEC
jgi:hypothetical protein